MAAAFSSSNSFGSSLRHKSFFAAVRSGDLNRLQQLLLQDDHHSSSDNAAVSLSPSSISPLMSLQNDAGETAIYIAAEGGLEEMFGYLIEFCDVDSVRIRSKAGLDAFHVAAKKGYLGIVKRLLSTWPELCRSCDSSNTSPLYSAAVQNHLEVVNAILDADPSSARIVRKNGKTALHTAARYGHICIVKALTERDPGMVSIKDNKCQTALHMAAKGQNPTVVEDLLLADFSILNERDKKGNTAVHIATRKCRPQILSLLLSYTSAEVNTINSQKETAMDLADKLQYGESALQVKEILLEAGGKHARHVGRADENSELKRTVSDIKHEVQSQLIQFEKTNRKVSGIAKELKKLHREAVQNTINSVTVVATLFASIAFLAIFILPGQYMQSGEADIAGNLAFRVFCLLNATSLFISLAVVVVQITLVAWDTRAQRLVVSVVNKLMWAACLSTCGAFLAIGFVVVGNQESWMAITMTVFGAAAMIGTLTSMCYFVFQHHFGTLGTDSRRRIKRASGSKSFSWSYSMNVSDIDEYNSDHEKIYAL